MSVWNILGIAYGLAALSSGVFVIRYRVRVSAWQTKMARENPTTLRQDPGKNMTPSHMVIVGLGAIGVGLSFLVHNVGLLAALRRPCHRTRNPDKPAGPWPPSRRAGCAFRQLRDYAGDTVAGATLDASSG